MPAVSVTCWPMMQCVAELDPRVAEDACPADRRTGCRARSAGSGAGRALSRDGRGFPHPARAAVDGTRHGRARQAATDENTFWFIGHPHTVLSPPDGGPRAGL